MQHKRNTSLFLAGWVNSGNYLRPQTSGGSAIFKTWMLVCRGIHLPIQKKCRRCPGGKFSWAKLGVAHIISMSHSTSWTPSRRCTYQQERLASHCLSRNKRKAWTSVRISSFCCVMLYRTVIIGYSDAHQPMAINEMTLIFMSKLAKTFIN